MRLHHFYEDLSFILLTVGYFSVNLLKCWCVWKLQIKFAYYIFASYSWLTAVQGTSPHIANRQNEHVIVLVFLYSAGNTVGCKFSFPLVLTDSRAYKSRRKQDKQSSFEAFQVDLLRNAIIDLPLKSLCVSLILQLLVRGFVVLQRF